MEPSYFNELDLLKIYQSRLPDDEIDTVMENILTILLLSLPIIPTFVSITNTNYY